MTQYQVLVGYNLDDLEVPLKNDRIFPKVSQKPINPLEYLWDTSIHPIKNHGVTIETSERLPAKNQRIVPRGPGASHIWLGFTVYLSGWW